MHVYRTLPTTLDMLIRPEVRVFGRTRSSFHVCGCTGLAAAVSLTSWLTLHQGLSLVVLAAIIGAALSTFLALAMLTKIILGEEQLVYYHHEIAVMGATALLLSMLNQPVLPYLELTLLGVGTFMAFGRVGCLMVGCCHGRSHAWGVRYRAEHAAAGFPHHLVGVRLLPVQVMESVSVFVIVAAGTGLIVAGHPPGTALVWYVGAYGVVRFGLEFLRGDVRPYRWGYSEAQWTSLALMIGVSLASYAGLLPWHLLHAVLAFGLVLAMVGLRLRRRLIRGKCQRNTWLGTTSQGLEMSADKITSRQVANHDAHPRAFTRSRFAREFSDVPTRSARPALMGTKRRSLTGSAVPSSIATDE